MLKKKAPKVMLLARMTSCRSKLKISQVTNTAGPTTSKLTRSSHSKDPCSGLLVPTSIFVAVWGEEDQCCSMWARLPRIQAALGSCEIFFTGSFQEEVAQA